MRYMYRLDDINEAQFKIWVLRQISQRMHIALRSSPDLSKILFP
jgi:hypothetical protein